jgi:hypothetical protein
MRRILVTLGVTLLLLLTMTVLATAAGASGGYTQGRLQLKLDGEIVGGQASLDDPERGHLPGNVASGMPSLDGPSKDPMY